jgi:hypothetical protein
MSSHGVEPVVVVDTAVQESHATVVFEAAPHHFIEGGVDGFVALHASIRGDSGHGVAALFPFLGVDAASLGPAQPEVKFSAALVGFAVLLKFVEDGVVGV